MPCLALVVIGLRQLQVDQGQDGHQEEDDGGYGRRQAEVGPGIGEGDAVGVGHQNVGGTGRECGVQIIRSAIGQQADQHKVVEFERETGNANSIGILFVPNPDLKTERTINYDLNIEKKLADKGNIFIAAFYTHFTDALAAAPFYLNGQDTVLYDGNLAAVYAQQNLDKAAIWGISGGFMFGIGKHFSVSGQTSYTVGNVLNSDGNKPLDHIAPLYGKLGVQFKNDKFSTDFYTIFNGAKPLDRYRVDGEDNLVYATPNGLPAWFTLNFKASYALNSYLNIQVGAENILDTNYRTFGSGISAGGRNLLLAIRTTF